MVRTRVMQVTERNRFHKERFSTRLCQLPREVAPRSLAAT
jgi:hypothetical protein